MKPPKHLCQSCHCLVGEDANFCSTCGQKKILKTISLRELVRDFFDNLFSLDSKFFRTFGQLIFIPGKLSQEYVAGKRQLYYTPIRLFFFWLTIAFILLNFVLSDVQKFSHEMDEEVQIETYKDSLRVQLNTIFEDSTSQQKLNRLLPENNILQTMGKSYLSIGNQDSISMKDLYLLAPKEIIKKYEVKSFWKKQFVHQMAKATKTPGDFQLYLISHLSWIVLASIPFIAFLLKLLYIRRKRKYLEHFIFILHLHTFIFIVATMLFIYFLLINPSTEYLSPILWILAIISFYFVASMKRFYQQSLLKTSFKFVLFLFAYPLIIAVALSIFVLINFLAF